MNDWQEGAVRRPYDYRAAWPAADRYRRCERRGSVFACCLTFDVDDVDQYPTWHAGVSLLTNRDRLDSAVRSDLWPVATYHEAVKVGIDALDGVGQPLTERIARTAGGVHVRRRATFDELQVYAELSGRR